MKEASRNDSLTQPDIEAILTEPRKASKREPLISGDFRRFFPDTYRIEQMESVIITLLTGWRDEQMAKSALAVEGGVS